MSEASFGRYALDCIKYYQKHRRRLIPETTFEQMLVAADVWLDPTCVETFAQVMTNLGIPRPVSGHILTFAAPVFTKCAKVMMQKVAEDLAGRLFRCANVVAITRGEQCIWPSDLQIAIQSANLEVPPVSPHEKEHCYSSCDLCNRKEVEAALLKEPQKTCYRDDHEVLHQRVALRAIAFQSGVKYIHPRALDAVATVLVGMCLRIRCAVNYLNDNTATIQQQQCPSTQEKTKDFVDELAKVVLSATTTFSPAEEEASSFSIIEPRRFRRYTSVDADFDADIFMNEDDEDDDSSWCSSSHYSFATMVTAVHASYGGDNNDDDIISMELDDDDDDDDDDNSTSSALSCIDNNDDGEIDIPQETTKEDHLHVVTIHPSALLRALDNFQISLYWDEEVDYDEVDDDTEEVFVADEEEEDFAVLGPPPRFWFAKHLVRYCPQCGFTEHVLVKPNCELMEEVPVELEACCLEEQVLSPKSAQGLLSAVPRLPTCDTLGFEWDQYDYKSHHIETHALHAQAILQPRFNERHSFTQRHEQHPENRASDQLHQCIYAMLQEKAHPAFVDALRDRIEAWSEDLVALTASYHLHWDTSQVPLQQTAIAAVRFRISSRWSRLFGGLHGSDGLLAPADHIAPPDAIAALVHTNFLSRGLHPDTSAVFFIAAIVTRQTVDLLARVLHLSSYMRSCLGKVAVCPPFSVHKSGDDAQIFPCLFHRDLALVLALSFNEPNVI